MLRSFHTFLVVVLTGSYSVVAQVPAIAEQQLSREQIQDKVAKWRVAFVNLRVVYETRELPPLNELLVDWSAPPDPNSAPQFFLDEWIWADHGLDLLDSRRFYWTSGKVGYRSINVFNGPKNVAFRARYQKPLQEVEELKALELQGVGVGKPISRINRTAMQGLYWPDTVEWLPDKLAKWEWTVERVEPVLGDPCVKIAVRYSARGTDTHVDNLWLDMEHDCLPRRYQELPNSVRKIGADFVVDEVQQLDSGLWFPKRMRIQLQTNPVQNQLIVVTEAAINLSLDAARFDPPAPVEGTIVTDGRTGRVYKHGEPPPKQTHASLPNTSNPVSPSAVPPVFWGFGWPTALICVSIALLAIGLWFRKTKT